MELDSLHCWRCVNAYLYPIYCDSCVIISALSAFSYRDSKPGPPNLLQLHAEIAQAEKADEIVTIVLLKPEAAQDTASEQDPPVLELEGFQNRGTTYPSSEVVAMF
jgi:hypothetical protein